MSLPDNKKEEEKKTVRAYKILREIFALLLWSFIFIKVVIFDIDIYLAEKYAPSLRWILNYRFFALLVIISVIFLVIGKKGVRRFLGYVAAYPCIVIFWEIPKLIFRNWDVAIAFAPAIYELVSSFRFIFVITVLASLCGIFIALSSDPYLLIPSMIFLGLFLIVHLYRNMRRAYRSSVFAGLADLIKKLRLGILGSGREAIWKKVEIDPNSEATQKTYEQQLTSIYFYNWVSEFISEKLHKVAKSRKPDLYLMASWLVTVFVVSLVYAFEYWAIYKINLSSFVAEYKLNFWTFWGFSFGKLTPSSISSIRPISEFATAVAYSELFCAMIIVVILVFSVLTAAREKYKEDIDDFLKELRGLGADTQRQLLQLYDLAMSDVENILLHHNAALVNMLRKSRGLPELPLPEKSDQKTIGN